MKKTAIMASMVLMFGGAASAEPMTSATFTMIDGTGATVGTDTSVTGAIGGGTWSVGSTTPFFGLTWTAHDGTTFGPGTYSFDTIQGGVYTGIVVGAGQVGGHILFDWGVTSDIDVINVWNIVESSVDATTIQQAYTSTDGPAGNPPNPDGIRGYGMIDGAFPGFSVNFDFSVNVPDTVPPVITLNGGNPQTVVINTPYTELGATCTDAPPQQAFTYPVVVDASAVDTTAVGSYPVTYDCQDTNANVATTVTRTVTVVVPDAVVTLLGVTPVVHECESSGFTYVDGGAQCTDPEDGTWTSFDLDPPGTSLLPDPTIFDVNVPGVSQDVTWTCTDSDGNTGTAVRVVNVEDNTAPDPGPYTLNSSVGALSGSELILETYEESAYANMNPTLESVTDGCDTTVPSLVMTSDVVDFNIVDGENLVTSTLNYAVTDASGNVMDAPLTVNVWRSEPVITLVGGDLTLDVGEPYVEQGMDIFDAQDGSIDGVTTSGVVTPTTAGTDPGSPRDLTVAIDASAVDTGTQGTYQVTYDVVDFDGNAAVQVIRTVTVGVFATGSNFTMLDSNGSVFGGTNDVIFDWDETVNTSETDLNFNMKIESETPWPFFGFIWTAHHIRVFGPGTYSFDTGCTVAEIEITGCPAGTAANSGPSITMTVGEGQLGAHILFDWNTTINIDIVNVWDVNGVWDTYGATFPINALWTGPAGVAPDPATTWKLVSRDVNGDLINGAPMIDGPFQGFYANFNAGPDLYLDTDGDDITDNLDNCILVPNPAQRDTDNDGYGNYCDPDFDNNLLVNGADLSYMKLKFFTTDPDADLNGDDIVNAGDLAILKTFFFKSPGPSGLVPE